MLLHVEVLHEGEVGPIHFLGTDADLVRLADKAIAVFVCGDIVFSFRAVCVDAHIVRDAVMVIAQGLIHAINGGFLALATVGQAEISALMAMEVLFLPLVGLHVLIRIVEIFTAKGLGFLETIGGDGKVDI